MSFFNKIFKSKQKNSVKEEKQTNFSKSQTDLTSLLMKKKTEGKGELYPILKPGNWAGIPHAVWIPYIGTQNQPEVVIGFGFDASENLSFLTRKEAAGLNLGKIYNVAMENIRNYPYEFKRSEVDNQLILTASGLDFSSEKMLDKSFLLEAGSILESNNLMVSAPRRRCLMLCNANAPHAFREKFIQLHSHAWQDDSYANAPICNAIYVMKSGEFAGHVMLNE